MEPTLDVKLKELPRSSGVYIFKNIKGKIIYIGKAKNLKDRVSTYFRKNLNLGTKTLSLVQRIVDIEHISTSTELEALILEAELIKKHRPKYNIALKDDKSYLYIVIRKEKLSVETKTFVLPKVMAVRRTDITKGDLIFGPYPNGNTARYILKTIRKAFPFRDCSVSKFGRYAKEGKPCLYGHLNLCDAPCLQEHNRLEHAKSIKRIIRFLSGDSSYLIRDFEGKMKAASNADLFEEAAYFRDMLKKFEYVRTSYRTADKYIENPNLLEDIADSSLQELIKHIPGLTGMPKRIECYDISNISGKEAVGSMTVAINGQLDKTEYRRFKIKSKDRPDDFFMMQEVLRRRLSRESDISEKRKKWGTPDLIVLDGGKGQVSAVKEVLNDIGIDNIFLIGLAKRYETIVYSDGDSFYEINLSKDNEGLRLLINLRDEAHRFAQSYHHHLRLKKFQV